MRTLRKSKEVGRLRSKGSYTSRAGLGVEIDLIDFSGKALERNGDGHDGHCIRVYKFVCIFVSKSILFVNKIENIVVCLSYF